VDLSAHGFYATPDIGFDWTTCKGSPFNYFTYGAAFAEVEIDTLTGDFHTRTADIVMDLGSSINPAIDIGQVCPKSEYIYFFITITFNSFSVSPLANGTIFQIEGAFIQGLGWVALEELKWGDSNHKWIRPGRLFTCGPGSYKIPSVNDIPLNFKVSLLKVKISC
jgi:xanthine dehydrogenase/oxidase